MTKDVLVSISGAHMVDGDSDDVSVITAGSYFCKNGKHYVIYDELIDGVEGAIRNTIKIREDIDNQERKRPFPYDIRERENKCLLLRHALRADYGWGEYR